MTNILSTATTSEADRGKSAVFSTFTIWEVLALVIGIAAAHLVSAHDYLLFHTVVELFSICIALAIFTISLNTQDISKNNFVTIIGYSYFFVGSLDTLHVLSYKGMPFFNDYDYYAPQFWIAARYLESACLLLGFIYIDSTRRINTLLLFSILLISTCAVIASILYFRSFPVCFVAGKGLTPFKIVSEYAIIVLFSLSFILLQQKRALFADTVFGCLRLSIVFMIAMEACFTVYNHDEMNDSFNELGHILKICAFYLLYKAIVVSSLRNPLMLVSNQLRDSEEKFRKAFANSPIGFATVADDRTIVDANASFCQLTGYELDRLRKLDFRDLIHPDDRAENLALHARMIEGEIPGFVIENRFVRKGGQSVWVRKSISVARRPDGKVKWVYALVEDVTDRHSAEQQLKRLNAELEQRIELEVRAREAAQAQLVQSEKLSALGQLAGGVAHDFNNILQAVVGGAELIERRADDPEKIKAISLLLRDTAQRGASITRRLLAFARRDELRSEVVDVAALLDGLREILPPALGPRIRIEIDAPPDIGPAKADPNQLETVLINLASNAADAIPGDGVIRIRAREDMTGEQAAVGRPAQLAPGRYIRLETIDTGAGMDDATLARAVEPFFTTKPIGKGTGLGLSMARGFAEQSGGALALASAVGAGTTVTLWLPVAEALSAKAKGSVSPPSAIRHGGRVLFVEDDPAVLELVGAELAHHGFDVLPADSGACALKKIDAGEDIALIVSDLSMPGMDGFAFLREALRRKPGLPGIVLTGYAGDATALAHDPLLGKTVMLLRKPVEAAVLAEHIASSLNATRSCVVAG